MQFECHLFLEMSLHSGSKNPRLEFSLRGLSFTEWGESVPEAGPVSWGSPSELLDLSMVRALLKEDKIFCVSTSAGEDGLRYSLSLFVSS